MDLPEITERPSCGKIEPAADDSGCIGCSNVAAKNWLYPRPGKRVTPQNTIIRLAALRGALRYLRTKVSVFDHQQKRPTVHLLCPYRGITLVYFETCAVWCHILCHSTVADLMLTVYTHRGVRVVKHTQTGSRGLVHTYHRGHPAGFLASNERFSLPFTTPLIRRGEGHASRCPGGEVLLNGSLPNDGTRGEVAHAKSTAEAMVVGVTRTRNSYSNTLGSMPSQLLLGEVNDGGQVHPKPNGNVNIIPKKREILITAFWDDTFPRLPL